MLKQAVADGVSALALAQLAHVVELESRAAEWANDKANDKALFHSKVFTTNMLFSKDSALSMFFGGILNHYGIFQEQTMLTLTASSADEHSQRLTVTLKVGRCGYAYEGCCVFLLC